MSRDVSLRAWTAVRNLSDRPKLILDIQKELVSSAEFPHRTPNANYATASDREHDGLRRSRRRELTQRRPTFFMH